MRRFTRRGDFLGGAPVPELTYEPQFGVSIAGAILWGEQHRGRRDEARRYTRFNRRGDSLGGATKYRPAIGICHSVSIAGAILWGEQREPG